MKLLKEPFSTHVGVVKMKALAWSYCYWNNLDKDIESLVKHCKPCCDVESLLTKALLHFWLIPKIKWQQVHMGYTGRYKDHHFLFL